VRRHAHRLSIRPARPRRHASHAAPAPRTTPAFMPASVRRSSVAVPQAGTRNVRAAILMSLADGGCLAGVALDRQQQEGGSRHLLQGHRENQGRSPDHLPAAIHDPAIWQHLADAVALLVVDLAGR
jgi:hypothetical protein